MGCYIECKLILLSTPDAMSVTTRPGIVNQELADNWGLDAGL